MEVLAADANDQYGIGGVVKRKNDNLKKDSWEAFEEAYFQRRNVCVILGSKAKAASSAIHIDHIRDALFLLGMLLHRVPADKMAYLLLVSALPLRSSPEVTHVLRSAHVVLNPIPLFNSRHVLRRYR